jgi:arabinose-5-phosphate isomerase
MEHRQFTPQDFRQFHPGGKLGAQLAKVADLMHTGDEVPLAGKDDPMTEVLVTMSRKGFGVVGVLDGAGALAGIITDGDLRRNMDGLLERSAGAVMTANPKTIGTGALAQEAVRAMEDRKITCLFALDDAGALAGIITIHDCLRAGVV